MKNDENDLQGTPVLATLSNTHLSLLSADSPLRCPAGSWGDSEGHDPLLGLIGGGGPLSSLGTSSVDTTAASSNNVVDSGAPLEAPYLTIHTHPSISTSARCKQCPPGRYVKLVFVIHVGGTRYVTSSTGNIMKIHARITLTVEFIRGYIFIFLFYVSIQLRV